MAVDTRARASGKSRAEVAPERDASVPLRPRWAPPGTSPTRRCSSPPTRRISSPACAPGRRRCPGAHQLSHLNLGAFGRHRRWSRHGIIKACARDIANEVLPAHAGRQSMSGRRVAALIAPLVAGALAGAPGRRQSVHGVRRSGKVRVLFLRRRSPRSARDVDARAGIARADEQGRAGDGRRGRQRARLQGRPRGGERRALKVLKAAARSKNCETPANWRATLTDDSAIAAAAIIGDSRMPNTG